MGPLLSMCCKKFGSVLAAIAHGVSVIMLLAFFEIMFFLEGWVFSKALLGMIAAVALQRFVLKMIIASALTREFKQDTSNIAWWTGKWYSMGWHSMSQPGREFLCKITELGMFACDFILGHFLLFIMLPSICMPYVDKFHSVMLFWLRPSRQIRPPIYSLKQSRLRKRRVIRFAILYFAMFILFIVLVIGPVIVRNFITLNLTIPLELMQPTGQDNNDTSASATGSSLIPGAAAASGGAAAGGSAGTATKAAASSANTNFNFGGGSGGRFRQF